jgi:hypothetical protein
LFLEGSATIDPRLGTVLSFVSESFAFQLLLVLALVLCSLNALSNLQETDRECEKSIKKTPNAQINK